MKRTPSSLGMLLEKAQFMHEKGFNCAETVVWALSSCWNLNMSTACATGFGGGIARTGATCGALTGAILALGSKAGRVEPSDDEKKTLCYSLGRQIINGFDRQMGTTLCREILGFVLSEEGGPEKYAQGGFKGGKCRDAIVAAVRAAIEVVDNLPEPEKE